MAEEERGRASTKSARKKSCIQDIQGTGYSGEIVIPRSSSAIRITVMLGSAI
jgi:hypothetical protein